MRSIPTAITWELLARGKWVLPAATFGAIAFFALILVALQNQGALVPRDPSMVIVHIVMVQMNIVFFIAAILAAQELRPSRLYAYPLTTPTIVACRILPAMAVVGLQMLIATEILNLLFELAWPTWGPALFAAIVTAAILASIWLTERSPGWLVVAMAAVGILLGMWFKARYGPATLEPQHYWDSPTAGEFLTLLLFGMAAFGIAVVGVARNRRGEPPISLGILEWFDRHLPAWPPAGPKFVNPLRAQLWFEWQYRGWIMPAAVTAVVGVGGVIVFIVAIQRNGDQAFEAILALSTFLAPIAVLSGLALGHIGRSDKDYAMGHFLATRPLSDADMARAVLHNAAKSILSAWAIWATAFMVACALLITLGGVSTSQLNLRQNWWCLPGVLFAMWIAVALLMPLALIGRIRQLFAVLCTLGALFVGMILLSKLAFYPQAQMWLWRGIIFGLTAAMLVAPAWCFIVAVRRSLIGPRSALAAIGGWAVATAILAIQWPFDEPPSVFGYLFLAGVLALAIAPVASAPLAIAANRHR